jgi:hypothetical protein
MGLLPAGRGREIGGFERERRRDKEREREF